MASLYGEVQTERNEKHQIGEDWIQAKLYYGSTDNSIMAIRVEMALDDGEPKLTVTLGKGIECKLVKYEEN